MDDKLVAKVNAIDSSGSLLQTKYYTDKSDLEKTQAEKRKSMAQTKNT